MTPTALARAGTIKANRAKPRSNTGSEASIQSAIVSYLAAVCPQAIVWAVPNSARRDRGGRAGNAVPGLRKGVYDLSLILPDGRFAAIEVKTDFGTLSADQLEFGKAMNARGVKCCVARSVEDVRSFLALIGVKTREAA